MGVQDDLQLAVLVAVQRDGVLDASAILAAWPKLDTRDLDLAVRQLMRDGALEVDPVSASLGWRCGPPWWARLASPGPIRVTRPGSVRGVGTEEPPSAERGLLCGPAGTGSRAAKSYVARVTFTGQDLAGCPLGSTRARRRRRGARR